jgi:hypothetical protein
MLGLGKRTFRSMTCMRIKPHVQMAATKPKFFSLLPRLAGKEEKMADVVEGVHVILNKGNITNFSMHLMNLKDSRPYITAKITYNQTDKKNVIVDLNPKSVEELMIELRKYFN